MYADPSYRASALCPTVSGQRQFFATPLCFKAIPLNDEMTTGKENTNREGHRVASAMRTCTYFVQFIPGLTAEKHNEMTLLQEVQRLNDEALAKMRDHARRERHAIEALHETRHQELRRDADKYHASQGKREYIVVAISALISVACAAIAYFAARS